MRQLSSELLILPPLRCGENQEFETDALRALLNCRIIRRLKNMKNIKTKSEEVFEKFLIDNNLEFSKIEEDD